MSFGDLLALLFVMVVAVVGTFLLLGLYLVAIIFRHNRDWVDEEKPPSQN